MRVINTVIDLEQYLDNLPANATIGFVPTMGALHAGHISLINKAVEQDQHVICSIFVNPTQFNEKSDYDNYPQVLDADIALLNDLKVDVIFAPIVNEIYPNGTEDIPHYEIGALEKTLEGEHRPGHFQGVCHIIEVFLQLIKPTHIYMGEKDWQQVAVVEHLINMNQHKTICVPCPTLREESGLAMSSRNRRLTAAGKEKAAAFYKCLCHIRDQQELKDYKTLHQEAVDILVKNDFTPEYIALCEADTLVELSDFSQEKDMRLIGAAFIEGIRLIDNIAI